MKSILSRRHPPSSIPMRYPVPLKNTPTRGTGESVERNAVSGPILLEREVSDADIGYGPKLVSRASRDDGTGVTCD